MPQVDALDEQRLASYLEGHVEGFRGPLSMSKFAGGQSNPTFRIDAASGVYVLRRQPPGELLKSAHAVDREYRVLQALSTTEVPVSKVYHLCEDRDVIGSMFYLMEFCQGNIYWSSALPEIDNNRLRSQMYDEMNRVLAAIHCVDIPAVGLTDYGRPGNYFQRQYDRWSKQYWASELKPIPEMNHLISWLGDSLPEDDGKVSLVHGDFRLDNLMFSSDNQRVIAVLDWELSTLGHPYADLAYQCMCMRQPATSVNNSMSGLEGVDTVGLGIPSEQQYIADYCERVGIDKIDNWNFYLAFSMFRMAAIIQGVAKRATQGNASSTSAHKLGTMVQPIAAMAVKLFE
jgi:aminoglycoside phosphotransferase (APT) family kinase protein